MPFTDATSASNTLLAKSFNRIHRIRHPRETYMACLNSGFATGFQIDISKMCASCTCWLDILVATHCKPKLRTLIRGLDWRFGDLNLFL